MTIPIIEYLKSTKTNIMANKPIPKGYHTVTPYLIVDDVDRQIEFLKAVFGAEQIEYATDKEGQPMHAEVRIGDSVVMMGQASGEHKPMPCMLYVYVDEVDATYEQALNAGGTSLQEPADQFYGDRSAGVKGPCGNSWWVATHVENVPPDEIQRRMEAMQ